MIVTNLYHPLHQGEKEGAFRLSPFCLVFLFRSCKVLLLELAQAFRRQSRPLPTLADFDESLLAKCGEQLAQVNIACPDTLCGKSLHKLRASNAVIRRLPLRDQRKHLQLHILLCACGKAWCVCGLAECDLLRQFAERLVIKRAVSSSRTFPGQS